MNEMKLSICTEDGETVNISAVILVTFKPFKQPSHQLILAKKFVPKVSICDENMFNSMEDFYDEMRGENVHEHSSK